MIPEIGHFALILALAIAITQSVVPLIGAQRRDRVLMAYGRQAALAQCAFIVISFAALTYAFVTSDFSVGIVTGNSHTAKPFGYKISAVWANHEGSMLLWVLILSLFGAALAWFGNHLPDTLKANALAVQGMIGAGFLAFIELTSNPFDRLDPAPRDGLGLNPILQDPGLAIHPPFLYLGYVGFSMAFSFSVAALIEGKIDAAWARWVRPWVLAAWCFLTIGITLGSAWAYYTLGWGGWWFWDPVENASFMPWLAGTALLHSALVVERRNALVSWTVLLGILTFSLSLVGTFLVRSGVLTSVHAFATDPARGVFILLLLVAATGGALTLYTIRMPHLKYGAQFAPVSREGALILNNMLLLVATGTVFLGTFYPLIVDLLTKDKISVGPPYYNVTFVPIMIPLFVVMAIGPMLKWKRSDLLEALNRLRTPAITAGVAAAIVLALAVYFKLGTGLLAVIGPVIGMGLAVWLIAGSLAVLAYRVRLGTVPYETSIALARSTPLAVYGLIIAHAGMGLAVAGITGMTSWATETVELMRPGQSFKHAGYDITFKTIEVVAGPNYEAQRATFDVTTRGRPVTALMTERRFYPVREQLTTSAGIRTNFISNIYIALGDPDDKGGFPVRFYYHPFVPWIWLGALVMALGGFVSLADRRLRVGAPQSARKRLPLSGLDAVPAE
ncbi:MAG: heme lyase CcmF/NrfE family subunit [Hyphomicrobiaceae bacterium]